MIKIFLSYGRANYDVILRFTKAKLVKRTNYTVI